MTQIKCHRCNRTVDRNLDPDECKIEDCPILYGEARIAEGHPWQHFWGEVWRMSDDAAK